MPDRGDRFPWTLRAGITLVGLLGAIAIGAFWLTPHDPLDQLDPVVSHLVPPGTTFQAIALRDGGRRLAASVRRVPGGIEIERAGAGERYDDAELAPGGPKPFRYVLGSDRFGRDILSRLLRGCQISLLVGISSALIAFALGLLIGGAAALGGRVVDSVLMRATDAILAIPSLFLLIAISSLLHPGVGTTIALFGATAWMGIARVARAEILSLKERDFILAARTVGLGPVVIFFRHVLPNVWTPLFIQAAVLIGNVILAESALSFIGLGIQPPTPSWGNMIAEGREVLTQAWWISLFPGIALALTVIGFSLLADGLRDHLDPRSVDADALPRR